MYANKEILTYRITHRSYDTDDRTNCLGRHDQWVPILKYYNWVSFSLNLHLSNGSLFRNGQIQSACMSHPTRETIKRSDSLNMHTGQEWKEENNTHQKAGWRYMHACTNLFIQNGLHVMNRTYVLHIWFLLFVQKPIIYTHTHRHAHTHTDTHTVWAYVICPHFLSAKFRGEKIYEMNENIIHFRK